MRRTQPRFRCRLPRWRGRRTGPRAARATTAELDQAIAAAREAYTKWSRSTPQERFDILDRAGTEILARKDELGRLLSREQGKPLADGVGEAARAGYIFKYFAGEALR